MYTDAMNDAASQTSFSVEAYNSSDEISTSNLSDNSEKVKGDDIQIAFFKAVKNGKIQDIQ